jgi:asparagine synthase (glutamine-hydrolysing)
LAHRRLAIIDPQSRSDQPLLSEDGRHSLIFNGEIYNFLEIKQDLTARGHRFRTESDTEVVLAAWREWGHEMLIRFNGMWALALYDLDRRELFLARDRYGVKPLLYARSETGFAFASERRALLALDCFDHEIDSEVARRAMFDPFGVEAGQRTLYRSIERIPAGHYMSASDTGQRLVRWWRSSEHLVQPPPSFTEAVEVFRNHFETSVRIRMRSDVAIGTCLSGGFDSSSIAAMMRHIAENGSFNHERESGEWRHAYIASFPGMLNDETPEALEAASYAGIDGPNVLDLSTDDPLESLDEVLQSTEDPFVSLPTAVWKIYRTVHRDGVRVTLDGHGADELMGGYRQGGQDLLFRLSTALGHSTGQGTLAVQASDSVKALRLRSRGLYFLRGAWPPRTLPSPADHDEVPGSWGLLNRRFYRMMHSTILPTLLRNFDRLSMAHSVEVRSPYLDWNLVQFVLSLPDAMKSDRRYSKVVAREAMRGLMPERIRAGTRKVGFGSQMPEWLNQRLGTWSVQILEKRHDVFDSIVDTKRLHGAVRSLNARQGWDWNNATRIWPYIHFRRLLDCKPLRTT